MTRPLLLGEAPGDKRPEWPGKPLKGLSKKLVIWAGWEPVGADGYYEALLARFSVRNVFETREQAYPWRCARARAAWERWLEGVEDPPYVVVALGRKAADAMIMPPEWPWGEWAVVGRSRTTVVPHPSGRNLVLNDPAMRELTGRVLREAVSLA